MSDVDWDALLNSYDQFYIFTHIRPDGDAIGSSLAWGKALEQYGKTVKIFCPDLIPLKYTFLPDINISNVFMPPGKTPTAAFTLDCSDLERLGYMKDDVLQLDRIINIDHHGTNLHFGDNNLVDLTAAATGEIIYKLICDLRLELTEDMGLCLYTAISSDTGSFKYENTTPQTMYIAAKLLEKGINPSFVSMKIFDEISLSSLRLLNDSLHNLKIDKSGKIAWMSIDEKKLEKYGVKPSELEGYINYAKNILGVEVGLFFHHTEIEGTKVGFRSKTVDISAVASSMGGGGHPRAAGCTVMGAPEAIETTVIQKITELLGL